MHASALDVLHDGNNIAKGKGLEVWGFVFFSSRRRHTRFDCDWSSDVCSSDLGYATTPAVIAGAFAGPRSANVWRTNTWRSRSMKWRPPVLSVSGNTHANSSPQIGRASCRGRV